jgi:tripartite-type tricarboxylate transporter receptor subunit TctC
MTLPRRQFLQLTTSAVTLPVMLRIASAEAYPTRPVHIVVGYPAGGAPDIMARLIGEWLSEQLGQQFVVDNRSGAASNIGTEMVAKALPDGYTLLMAVSTKRRQCLALQKSEFQFHSRLCSCWKHRRHTFCDGVQPVVPGQNLPGVHRLRQG